MKTANPSLISSFLNRQLRTSKTTGWLINIFLHLAEFVKEAMGRNRLTMAVNEAAPVLMVAAVNEAINGEDEWFSLSPLGEHPNDVGLQVVDMESHRSMVTAFNSLLGKTARFYRGVPIMVGHPNDPKWRKDNPEIYAKYPHPVGRVVAMEMRGDMAWFKPAFNETGRDLVSGPGAAISGFSPGWGMVEVPARGQKVFRPVLLDHIGLTNFPQISGNKIGLNEAEQTQPTKEDNMPEWLLKLLGYNTEETPSETEVQGKLQTALNERSTARTEVTGLNTQLQTLTTKLTTATNEKKTAEEGRKAEREARATVVVTTAINEGRIVEADRQAWIDSLVGAQDFDVEAKKLVSLKGAINTDSQVDGLGNRKGEGKEVSTVFAINEAVSKYAKEHGLDLSTSDGHNKAYAGAASANLDLFNPKKA